MDPKSEFANEDAKSHNFYQGNPSDISLHAITSRRFNRDQHVQLLAKKKFRNKEPDIPATTIQKLFFYNTYTSSLSKIQMVFRERQEFNKFIWYYILNVFCKSLPSAYVYMFLGSFAPKYHFFLHKMFPAMYGCNWVFILTAICELLYMTDSTLYCLDYVVCGLIYKVPWRRCPNQTTYIPEIKDHKITCCNITEFKAKFINTTVTKYFMYYVSVSTNEHFNLAQFEYYYHRLHIFWDSSKGAYITVSFLAFVWFLSAKFNIMKKVHIWQILSKTHVLLNVMLLIVLYDCVAKYSSSDVSVVEVKVSDDSWRKHFIDLDINVLAESMTAPPVAHVISAKSTIDYIHPNRDSALMIISNAINYIFRGILTVLMRMSCEHELHAPLLYFENVDIDQVFNIYPVYFATLQYGDIYVVIFFILCTITEFCTLIISCQCFLEAIVCEWSWCKPHYAALLIFLTSAFAKTLINAIFLLIAFYYLKGLCTLVEALILYWLYPLGRLKDDIKFHNGVSLTKLRVFSFQIVPVFYAIKLYIMFNQFSIKKYGNAVTTRVTFYLFPLIPFVVGVIYAIYFYIVKKRTSWTQLIKPAPEWGPEDICMRNLRKQFDSRKFIVSQAARDLSRHLIENYRVYKLDIDYNSTPSRPRLSYIHENQYSEEGKKST